MIERERRYLLTATRVPAKISAISSSVPPLLGRRRTTGMATAIHRYSASPLGSAQSGRPKEKLEKPLARETSIFPSRTFRHGRGRRARIRTRKYGGACRSYGTYYRTRLSKRKKKPSPPHSGTALFVQRNAYVRPPSYPSMVLCVSLDTALLSCSVEEPFLFEKLIPLITRSAA